MCGRFTLAKEDEDLLERFEVEQLAFDYFPRYNIAPGQMITAVIRHQGKNRIGQLKWGLIPSWAKDPKIGFQMINAKSESVLDKPSFRNAFIRKRCLIPADGFYEWKTTPTGKQPLRFTLKNQGIFAMAGLYETWMSPEGAKISSCTILTTSPNGLISDVHDRMPVILRTEHEPLWLDSSVREAEILLPLLKPFPEEDMTAYPVSPIVGNVKNETAECIAKFEGSPTLF